MRAYVFDLASELPTEPIAVLQDPAAANYDQFGGDVSVYGNYALVAASFDDTVNVSQGAAYLYEILNTHPVVDDLTLQVNEDDIGLSPFGTVVASDAESSVTFEITGGTGTDVFVIDELSGELTVVGALDFETTAAYTVLVTVTDDQGAYARATVTINVVDVNEAPVAVDDILAVDEDLSLTGAAHRSVS